MSTRAFALINDADPSLNKLQHIAKEELRLDSRVEWNQTARLKLKHYAMEDMRYTILLKALIQMV